jgi:hypothetical protein
MSSTRKHTYRHLLDPERIEVRDSKAHLLATFTNGAHTVVLAGPRRKFVEGGASVSHAKWVRTYPAPFDREVDWDWLEQALAANREGIPDVFAIAMQYIRSAPTIYEDSLQIAGDAHYGPGTEKNRQEGADFNDYLGVTWSYPGEQDVSPEPDKFHCLDCSGHHGLVLSPPSSKRRLQGSNPPLPRPDAGSRQDAAPDLRDLRERLPASSSFPEANS